MKHTIVSDDVWSDFKDGSNALDYFNGAALNAKKISELGMGAEIWNPSDSHTMPCVKMSAFVEYKLASVACSETAKYICTKQSRKNSISFNMSCPFSTYSFLLVCPDGFTSLDGINCVTVIDTAASKEDALAECRKLNPSAIMVTPKTEVQQRQLQKLLNDGSVTEDIHIGLSKADDGHWYWDDGDPLFVQCMLHQVRHPKSKKKLTRE